MRLARNDGTTKGIEMTELSHGFEQPGELPLPRLDTRTPLPNDLPVAGGWGYTKDDACVLTDDREIAGEGEPIGLDFEFAFIESRLIAELNAMPLEEELAQIRWKVQTQSIERDSDGAPAYDCLTVLVTAYLRSDWEALAAAKDQQSPDVRAHRRRGLRLVSKCDFWFDVSRVKGIPDDAEFFMRTSSGLIHAAHEEAAPHA